MNNLPDKNKSGDMRPERVCEKNCPDYKGMEILHKEQCGCSCHKPEKENLKIKSGKLGKFKGFKLNTDPIGVRPEKKENIGTLVRDLTKMGSISKGEATRRIKNLLKEQREKDIEKIKNFPTFKTKTAGGEREIILKEDLIDELKDEYTR